MEDQRAVIKNLRLNKINQVGIVVGDIDSTMRYYSSVFGINPWYKGEFPEEQRVYYKGKEKTIKIDIAMAYCGDVQIELIEPRGGGGNTYSEHLRLKGEGLHHLGFFVNDIKKRLSLLKSINVKVLQSGSIKTSGSVTNYAYLDTVKTGGVILELIETRFLGLPMAMTAMNMKLGCLTGNAKKVKLR